MSAEQYVGCALNEECVLHVASGMVGSEVHCSEHMPVVLDFGALCYCESQTAEDIDNLLAHERQGMSGSGDNRRGIAAQVGALSSGLGIVEPVAYFRKMVGETWTPGMNKPFDPIASKLAEEAGIRVICARGTDIENTMAILEGKEFVGTVIK